MFACFCNVCVTEEETNKNTRYDDNFQDGYSLTETNMTSQVMCYNVDKVQNLMILKSNVKTINDKKIIFIL